LRAEKDAFLPLILEHWCPGVGMKSKTNKIWEPFQSLFDIDKNRKKSFHLYIDLAQHHIRLKIRNVFFDALRPIVLGFEEHGANVLIHWHYGFNL
jgi:hypothetical protein